MGNGVCEGAGRGWLESCDSFGATVRALVAGESRMMVALDPPTVN